MEFKKKPAELTVQEKTHYQERFRKLVRRVAMNQVWLEMVEEDKLTKNAKRNIAMVFRHRKVAGLLTNMERILLRKAASLRTIAERKILVKLVLNLQCFAKYPPKVRARLAPRIKYMMLRKHRSLIKQNRQPLDVYFILVGEVEVVRSHYDKLSNSHTEHVVALAGPGDIIGDIEFCEGVKRGCSYIATSDTELLVLYEDDFHAVLSEITYKQWMDKKRALHSLHYFKYFTNNQIITAAKLSKFRQFQPLDSIYIKDEGILNHCYFVLSGECMILQCLKMKVITKPDGKTYRLVEVKKGEESIFQVADPKNWSHNLMNIPSNLSKSQLDLNKQFEATFPSINERFSGAKLDAYDLCAILKRKEKEALERLEAEKAKRIILERRASVETIVTFKAVMVIESSERISTESSVQELEKETASEEQTENQLEELDVESETDARTSAGQDEGPNENLKAKSEEEPRVQIDPVIQYSQKQARQTVTPSTNNISEEEAQSEEQSESSTTSSTDESTTTDSSESIAAKKPNYVIETHFIDVGTISFGGVFGIGEEMIHRVIMARTTVQCLILPKFWLLEKHQNPANIWQQRLLLLSNSIPNRQQVFEHFLKNKKWKEYRTNLVNSYVGESIVSNTTKEEDIPIMCNILDGK